jgi:hypothetical protein
MPEESQPALTRTRVISCVVINQFATPGLGSVMCRKYFSGTCQLVLAVVGFVLFGDWMCRFFYALAMKQMDEPVPQGSYGWLARWGLIIFGAGWVWALGTSLVLLRQTKGQGEPTRLPPPRLSDQPPDAPGTAA